MHSPTIYPWVKIVKSFHLFFFIRMMDLLREREDLYSRLGASDTRLVVPDAVVATVREIVATLRKELNEAQFNFSVKRIDGQFFSVAKSGVTAREFATQLKVLREVFRDESEEKWFAIVPDVQAKAVFTGDDIWFKTSERFPGAAYDIEEATFCYALGRNTAVIFHCMRVAEIGLRALARRMKVKIPKRVRLEWAEWQAILREMNAICENIVLKRRAGPSKDAALEFYRGALGQFYGFKDEYRNHVMHTRGKYDEHRAASVLFGVRDFMVKLSEHIDEKGGVVHRGK